MRFLTADFIFPICKPPVKNGIIFVDGDKIIEIIDPSAHAEALPVAEYFKGILCPGFINAHCHLELSHLKGKLTKAKKLTGFIQEIVKTRDAPSHEVLEQMNLADEEMYSSGVSVVADISNTNASITVKNGSNIHYHSFIEIFDLMNGNHRQVLENGSRICDEFRRAGLSASVTPHAPYTVSKELLHLIRNETGKSFPLTIHNEETESENQMYLTGTGELIETLKKIAPSYVFWQFSGKTSLDVLLECFNTRIQLVHNTFSREADIINAEKLNEDIYWCLCPAANLYIEERLPDALMFMRNVRNITVGTDSYASNSALKPIEELKILTQHFPSIKLHDLLRWSTYNGARFLKLQDEYGCLDKNMRPGIIHITNIDLDNMKLTPASMSKRVV